MSRRSYKDALKAFSARTGSPLSSLLVSFAVLHEITAVAPLVGIFYGAKALGVGERVVGSVVDGPTEGGYIREQCRTLVQEGEGWAERVGRRYGIWGFPQTPKGTKFEKDPLEQISSHIAGDVANAVFAYGATKASLKSCKCNNNNNS